MRHSSTAPLRGYLLLTLATLLAQGCASAKIPAQWTDPAFATRSLHGAKVLVSCEAEDVATQRVCQDEFAARLSAAGVEPVKAATAQEPGSRRDGALLAEAQQIGARATFATTVTRDASVIGSGTTIGIGVGASSGGWGSGTVVGGGVGTSAPIGATRVDHAYGASMVLTDVATDKLMWTMRAVAPASQDVVGQIRQLAMVGVEEAQKAGMF
jgi:hypothetical protein